jgi:hypothetical protein
MNNNQNVLTVNPNEKIMAVNFVSMGSQVITNYNIICKNTDLFVDIEKKMYQDYPQFKEMETYFTVGARKINRFKTIEENNIKNNDVISVFTIDN